MLEIDCRISFLKLGSRMRVERVERSAANDEQNPVGYLIWAGQFGNKMVGAAIVAVDVVKSIHNDDRPSLCPAETFLLLCQPDLRVAAEVCRHRRWVRLVLVLLSPVCGASPRCRARNHGRSTVSASGSLWYESEVADNVIWAS